MAVAIDQTPRDPRVAPKTMPAAGFTTVTRRRIVRRLPCTRTTRRTVRLPTTPTCSTDGIRSGSVSAIGRPSKRAVVEASLPAWSRAVERST